MWIARRCASTPLTLHSCRNIRSGPTAPPSGAGFRCRSGTAIDASDPDAWVFPVGTRLWKEFSFAGARVETRYLERKTNGQWLYAAYVWSPDGRDATLAPERGKRNAFALGGGRAHTIPGVSDCKACHQGGRSEVLGFSALQLSPERDPNALHAEKPFGIDLRDLIERGLLVGLPASLAPPRITAASATERAALGYLHGNCGHCHNERGPLSNVGLFLRHALDASSQAVATTWAHPMKKPAPGQSPDAVSRIEPGHPERSALLQRIASRYPALQMPPLGTALVDEAAVALLRRWILETEARDETNPTRKDTCHEMPDPIHPVGGFLRSRPRDRASSDRAGEARRVSGHEGPLS